MKFYLVGGACRDVLLGKEPRDLDFVVVGATPKQMLDKGYKQVGKDFPVFLEPENGWEVALARVERKVGIGYTGFETDWKGVTIEQDLERRDLTINSIAIEVDWEETLKRKSPPLVGEWIDPFHGIEDIKDKFLCPTSEAFKEDPLRVLRLARFSSRYPEFEIAEKGFIYSRFLSDQGELESLTPERVWLETEKALKSDKPSNYFWNLVFFKIPFVQIFKDMLKIKERNDYHREENVFVHTMMVLDEASVHKDPEINFACLLHDIAKPKCYNERGNGHGHDAEGVQMVKDWCKEWKVPNNYRDIACLVTEHHQRIHTVLGIDANKMSRPKSVMKIFEQTNALTKPERFKKILLACEADSKGRVGLSANDEYHQKDYLLECLAAVKSVDTKSISSKMLSKGKQGTVIGQAIREERIKVIRGVQKKWKTTKHQR